MINKPIGNYECMLTELKNHCVKVLPTDDLADCLDGILRQKRLPGTAYIRLRSTLVDSERVKVIQELLEQRTSAFFSTDMSLPIELRYSLKEAFVI